MTQSGGREVIGGGAIAERHMQALSPLGGVVPRWIVSLPEAAAQLHATRWKFAAGGSAFEPALADPQVQLVLIASPKKYAFYGSRRADHTKSWIHFP